MAIDLVVNTFPNGSTRVVSGEVVRVISTKKIEKSRANGQATLDGTVGVVVSGNVAALAPDVLVALSGTTFVLLEAGLTPIAGQLLYVSEAVAGRATNVVPAGEGSVAFPIGTITVADAYARTGGVTADVNSLSSVVEAGALGGATGITGATGVTGATGATGVTGATGTAGAAGGISKYAMFYGLTAGTGMSGTDYAATVAVKTSAGTGRVPFPQNGPASGIARVDGSSFTLPDVGTYHVTYKVHTTEPGQLQLELAGTDVPNSETADANPTSGGHLLVGNCLITTVAINAVLAVVNPSGNAAALTITPADGSLTHANAQSITILKVA